MSSGLVSPSKANLQSDDPAASAAFHHHKPRADRAFSSPIPRPRSLVKWAIKEPLSVSSRTE